MNAPIFATMAPRYETTPRNDNTNDDPIVTGQTVAVGKFEIHLCAQSIKVTDVTNASKRGKTCDGFRVCFDRHGQGLAMAIMMEAHRSEGIAELGARTRAWIVDGNHGGDVEVFVVKAIEVSSLALTVTAIGPKIDATFKPREFSFRDPSDHNNGTSAMSLTPTGASKAHKWAMAHREQISEMSFWEVVTALSAIGAVSHTWCAVD